MNNTGRTSRHGARASMMQDKPRYHAPTINRSSPPLDLIGGGKKPKPQPCRMPDVIPIAKSTLAERMDRIAKSTPALAAKLGRIYMRTHCGRRLA